MERAHWFVDGCCQFVANRRRHPQHDSAVYVANGGICQLAGYVTPQLSDLHIGYPAPNSGELQVTAGGQLATKLSFVGYSGIGTVSVSGQGSSWTATSIDVGLTGTGTLNIQNGGVVTTTGPFSSYIGDQTGSVGTVTVNGTGSTWTTTGSSFTVGGHGKGTLNITAGGKVVANTTGLETRIGNYSTSSGSMATVNAGTWNNSGDLVVGADGDATLNIQNGGLVTNNYATITYSTGNSVVNVDGGTWKSTGDLSVAYHGSGTLNITGGGNVQNNYGTIGESLGAIGTVTVDGSLKGTKSSWTNSGSLYAGYAGKGTLTIKNGAVVTSGSGTIGRNTSAKTARSASTTAPGTATARSTSPTRPQECAWTF